MRETYEEQVKARGQRRPTSAVAESGEARAATGAVAVSGIVHGDIAVHGPTVARSGYRQQITRIAPPELIGRQAELSELAAFCTATDAGSYTWWRASAWAGKTALLSWFALHPPPGVTVVSFFITARFAAQSDRTAFIDVVGEQLAALLGRTAPAFLTPSTRDAHLLTMLGEAAELCRGRGERLVLLVDGLDEDRGVTIGPDAHSIAALLPARPGAGLRVVVAGRPHPPVPADVPGHHPLHDPRIVRTLAGSPYAAAVRADCERELVRLLNGASEERDLLGFVVAAGGGLSVSDLAQLTGMSDWETERHLRAVTGRTFATRANQHPPPGSDADVGDVYVLGHEELQSTALTMFGPARLSAYRERLHSWAMTYREQRWPQGTPDYLLLGYARLLRSLGDLPRAVACATDAARQDRQRERTGGDAAALVEIDHAWSLLVPAEETDLVRAALLAAHRSRLKDRNDYPEGLPALWAALGQPDRAEALARGMGDSDTVAPALAQIAVEAGRRGDSARAQHLADTIENLAEGFDSACWRARRLAAMAEAAGAAGDHHRALVCERAIGAILEGTASRWKPHVLASQARAAAAGGSRKRAVELADAIERTGRDNAHSWQMTDVRWAAESSDPDRVNAVLGHLRVLAGTVRSARRRARIEASLVLAEAAAGTGKHGPAMLEAAAELSHGAEPSLWKLDVAGALSEAVVASGDQARAARLADVIAEAATVPGHPCWQDSSSVMSLVRAAMRTLRMCADLGRAAALSELFEAVFRTSAAGPDGAHAEDQEPGEQAQVLGAASVAAALAGDMTRAHTVAASVRGAYERAETWVELAKVSLDRGDRDRAAALLADAERLCRDHIWPRPHAEALTALVEAACTAGERERATRLTEDLAAFAATIAVPSRRADAQVPLVGALARTGRIAQAEAVARATAESHREWAYVELVKVLAGRGEFGTAQEIVRGLGDREDQIKAGRSLAHAAITHRRFALAERLLDAFPGTPGDQRQDQARLLTALAGAAAIGGAHHRATVLAECVQELAWASGGSEYRDEMVRYEAEALAWSRRFDAAEDRSRSITDSFWRALAVDGLVQAAARLGEPGFTVWAHRAARLPCADSRYRSTSLTLLARATAFTGDLRSALAAAERIPLPGWRASALAGLSHHAPAEQGRQLMSRALELGDWPGLLDDLVRCVPGTLLALADMFLSLDRTETDDAALRREPIPGAGAIPPSQAQSPRQRTDEDS
ncbi:hypothetical protein QMK19_23300 [Streptomyces sp. H10-C2]|uniref:hypothetical protein n=1 Tax=unclassified Streptomyces TaxID=2593676 RepID=UPI0024BB6C96|nr:MULTISPECIES: hypothetical protein [unclassified Streptomyces]MDJ0342834.1 hypothetical protein [Streptomyces sp. PH10-H1]MDJ0372512.1 hypothetical protein [Streptomyces sp. H10-C2]